MWNEFMESFTGINIRTRKLKLETVTASRKASKNVFHYMFKEFQQAYVKIYKDEGI